MGKKKIIARVEVDTDADLEIIRSALTRGIYVGLDTRRIAPPNKVDVVEIVFEQDREHIKKQIDDWFNKPVGNSPKQDNNG